jgi:pilus assembly protein Flp/PilA
MHAVKKFLKQLKSDEDGASLIEYTVLLAIILVAVIAIITAVGKWVNNQWANLNTAI